MPKGDHSCTLYSRNRLYHASGTRPGSTYASSNCNVGLQDGVHARSLREAVAAVAPEELTYVSTPRELRDSIKSRARDIVIQNHLDLTDLELDAYQGVCANVCENPLGIVQARSIRVRAVRHHPTTQPWQHGPGAAQQPHAPLPSWTPSAVVCCSCA